MTSVEVLGITDSLSSDNEKYAAGLKAVASAFTEALDIFNSPQFVSKEGWNKETESAAHDIVYSKYVDSGKLYALRCEMPKDCETVFKDYWDGVEKLCDWNSNLAFSKILAKLSSHVDVCHFDSFESRGDTFFEDAKFQYANRDILIVKGRDFLITRMHRKLDKGYITVGRSFELADIPETRANVRY
uniref:START domain-containing protein n=1 Tax=Ascaris lumbricoides TaxID=6252 RepID=A0A0M3I694_ASCLU